ncbi:protein of unknown function [Pararobbsia alpina]
MKALDAGPLSLDFMMQPLDSVQPALMFAMKPTGTSFAARGAPVRNPFTMRDPARPERLSTHVSELG